MFNAVDVFIMLKHQVVVTSMLSKNGLQLRKSTSTLALSLLSQAPFMILAPMVLVAQRNIREQEGIKFKLIAGVTLMETQVVTSEV